MSAWVRVAAAGAAFAVAAMVWAPPSGAHRPITSPFTFNEDVFPILRDKCGACHVEGGVAPMSLLSHADAVPWGESMRMELIAGHMPPWRVTSPPGRVDDAYSLTARELNVLLTWASGGTPPGDAATAPGPATVTRDWPLGAPDTTLDLPEVVLGAETTDDVRELVVPVGNAGARSLRALDLQPGTPSLVRSAQILVREGQGAQGNLRRETRLALWVPGDRPVELGDPVRMRLPPQAELVVRVHYRKTWQYERQEMRDRSRIGLYDAMSADGRDLGAIALPVPPAGGASTATIEQDLLALGVYADAAVASGDLRITAVRPDGSREELIAFRARPGWVRRYWFTTPVPLSRGTRLETITAGEDHAALLLPPGMQPSPQHAGAAGGSIVVNVVAPGAR